MTVLFVTNAVASRRPTIMTERLPSGEPFYALFERSFVDK